MSDEKTSSGTAPEWMWATADYYGDDWFVHTVEPRFWARQLWQPDWRDDHQYEVRWIDPKPEDEAVVRRLLEEGHTKMVGIKHDFQSEYGWHRDCD